MPLIRRAELNDAAPIARVHVDSWRSSYQGLLPDAYLDTLSEIRVAASWSEILKRRNRSGATFVADAEAEGVVGFADCGPERGGRPATGEITTLYLLDEWQQRGLGRRLVATAARHLAAGGAEHLAIWVLANNDARGFYETLDGHPDGERQIRFAGVELGEVCYRWPDIRALLLIDIFTRSAA